jgi:hypothetical protein
VVVASIIVVRDTDCSCALVKRVMNSRGVESVKGGEILD